MYIVCIIYIYIYIYAVYIYLYNIYIYMNFHQRIIKIPIIGCADENICTDSTIAQICVGPDRIQR